MKPVKTPGYAQRRTERQRTSVPELEEEWKAEKASLSGTQTIKAELEQAKIAIEQARRVGDLARMSELQYGKIPELEKQLEAATQLEGKLCVCCVIK